ncbi:vitamin K epoxide reductase family protein [Synechococcus sp. PCC 7336]|uniref:vitamin K epoxide reductase family protein n=1 Tax=Synechococcus sp. PCC 7336 TaxID=195250 RepID=UPI00034B30F7|nr:vitamin K epoxide reductase family protein [Synechococcus sp. PCC 7336]
MSSTSSSPATPWLHHYSRIILAAIAIAGSLLTSYLTANKLLSQQVALCGEGGGCGVVLGSRWATFLGVPAAFWGMLGFISVFLLAAASDELPLLKRWRWPALFGLTTAMFAFEMYFAYLMLFVLKAFCLYCTVAIVFTTVIWLTVLFGKFWVDIGQLVVSGVAVAIATLLVVVGVYANQPKSPSAFAAGLAEHLQQTEIAMYGANWCPHCQEQKELFGTAFNQLHYVECSPYGGRGTPQAPECVAEEIKSYPTWIYKGDRIYGIQTLEQLAALTGFEGDGAAAVAVDGGAE